jgi:hypothetical protein
MHACIHMYIAKSCEVCLTHCCGHSAEDLRTDARVVLLKSVQRVYEGTTEAEVEHEINK